MFDRKPKLQRRASIAGPKPAPFGGLKRPTTSSGVSVMSRVSAMSSKTRASIEGLGNLPRKVTDRVRHGADRFTQWAANRLQGRAGTVTVAVEDRPPEAMAEPVPAHPLAVAREGAAPMPAAPAAEVVGANANAEAAQPALPALPKLRGLPRRLLPEEKVQVQAAIPGLIQAMPPGEMRIHPSAPSLFKWMGPSRQPLPGSEPPPWGTGAVWSMPQPLKWNGWGSDAPDVELDVAKDVGWLAELVPESAPNALSSLAPSQAAAPAPVAQGPVGNTPKPLRNHPPEPPADPGHPASAHEPPHEENRPTPLAVNPRPTLLQRAPTGAAEDSLPEFLREFSSRKPLPALRMKGPIFDTPTPPPDESVSRGARQRPSLHDRTPLAPSQPKPEGDVPTRPPRSAQGPRQTAPDASLPSGSGLRRRPTTYANLKKWDKKPDPDPDPA